MLQNRSDDKTGYYHKVNLMQFWETFPTCRGGNLGNNSVPRSVFRCTTLHLLLVRGKYIVCSCGAQSAQLSVLVILTFVVAWFLNTGLGSNPARVYWRQHDGVSMLNQHLITKILS